MDFDDGEEAIELIRQYVHGMSRIAYVESGDPESQLSRDADESVEKQLFDHQWRFFCGVTGAHTEITEGQKMKEATINATGDKTNSKEVYSLDKFEEHYEQFGYGPYGEGLQFGKRLFFWSGNEFSFDVPESEETDDTPEFTFTE